MAVSVPGTAEGPEADDEPAAKRAALARRASAFRIDPRRPLWYRVARFIVLGVLRLWFRPNVIGLDKVPASGPLIVAPVHRSNIDFGFAALVTRRKVFYMAKEQLWTSAAFGRLLEHLGVFPVHREGADRESVRRAEQVLKEGQVLVMFPEGSRRFGDKVEPLQEGVAFLAARTGASVVPVGISGSERAMPKGAKIPKPLKVTLFVGDPIVVEAPDGRRVPRSEIHRLSLLLQERLQAAYDEAAR
jgi:1-acyl-sn-glycerol-3-phosphate acyltransferase